LRSRFGHSDWPSPEAFAYTFDHLAEVVAATTQRLGLERYSLFVQDYGGHDPSFNTAGAPAYRDDVPDAEIHILDAGHFALDEATDEIAALTADFLTRRVLG
jgi:pimeloyl-ACP methyl ester carboxylesterase